MRDFSIKAFKMLLTELEKNQYEFKTFVGFMETKAQRNKMVILRHDVDKKPLRSSRTAELEKELGIKGTYYFRVNKDKLPKEVIERVAKMGHEIGYHYDDLHDAGGNVEKALALFQKNLVALRELVPVRTACMHGSPMSRFDNRDMWKDRNYREFGIIAEPYFDIDFNKVLYLTDTGRRWDGGKVSIRDKVRGDGLWVMGKKEEKIGNGSEVMDDGEDKRGERRKAIGDGEDRVQKTENREDKEKGSRGAVADPPVFNLHSTGDIIKALKKNRLPEKIMLTVHPQRWNDNYFSWLKEWIWQNVKNGVKYFIVKDIR